MVEAAGHYRRTQAERDDQHLSWERPDQAFFAAGACHVLAWTCRSMFPDRGLAVAAIRLRGEPQVFHTYAIWNTWAFDHSGWNSRSALLAANEEFEGLPVEEIDVGTDLAAFCREHHHRMPEYYWADPRPRARAYVARFPPPWTTQAC